MFIIPYNTTLWVCAAIVIGIIGFVIYGCIKGFENTFTHESDDEEMPHSS